MKTVTPRSKVRSILTEHVEGGAPLDGAVNYTVDAILDDADLTGEIVAAFVHAEAGHFTRKPRGPAKQLRKPVAELREELAQPAPAPLPVPASPPAKRSEPSILVDMANMGRIELEGLAEELEKESDKAGLNAAFIRTVAASLGPGQTVRERYTKNDLLSIRSRLTIRTDRTVHLGDRQILALTGKAR